MFIIQGQSQMIIQTDASNCDWGAYCQGTATGRKWSKREQSRHIDIL